MTELLSTPVKEYPQFEATLSLLPVLWPSEVLDLLSTRVAALETAIAQERAQMDAVSGLPRLFLIETEYHLAMRQAELEWVRALLAELKNGSFPRLDWWERWHRTGVLPPVAGDGTPDPDGRTEH
ncbi:MAG TPA: hypothetical protein VG253_28560 [Streptosporangiaceae bacterium]|jgi:hypothetical protein|nr:hypothetical protein [Streptosporangiaceae bacterium]